ncbi:hypothetical protein NOC27_2279 [Nitrosococcus oceani AFC27]|nr:hypothetical protein NOC27_2279 [Nitrosococcus oceani AFC27]
MYSSRLIADRESPSPFIKYYGSAPCKVKPVEYKNIMIALSGETP